MRRGVSPIVLGSSWTPPPHNPELGSTGQSCSPTEQYRAARVGLRPARSLQTPAARPIAGHFLVWWCDWIIEPICQGVNGKFPADRYAIGGGPIRLHVAVLRNNP